MPETTEHMIDLCGLWRFQPDPADDGLTLGYPSSDYDDRRWREVRVPSDYATSYPDLAGYAGKAWYRRIQPVPAHWHGKRVVLRLQGVGLRADIWINGQWIGHQPDPYLPFSGRIDQHLTLDSENVIVIRTDNALRSGEMPGPSVGWRPVGGLLRGIELRATDLCFIDHVAALAVPKAEGGDLTLRTTVRNLRDRDTEVRVTANVRDAKRKVLAQLTSEDASIPTGDLKDIAVESSVPGAKSWSPKAPSLYTLDIQLWDGEAPLEMRSIRIGFRTVDVTDGKFRLNGEPLSLTGFNRHEDTSTHAMSPDPETVRRDLAKMKNAGANFVRLCHYPHDPSELNLCDEIGLLVMAEIPLYWWHGRGEGSNASERDAVNTLRAAKRQLRAMIDRDLNHPSIALWSVSNETDESRPEVASGNADLIRLAKRLDPTRLAVHVSNRWQDHAHFTADDILCVNGYPGYDARRKQDQVDFEALSEYWRTELAALHDRYPDKPILVTEFGYPAIGGCPDGLFGEDTQAAIIDYEYQGMQAPYVCGTTVWCWADHLWPERTFEYYYTLNHSPFGVLTRERREKRAYRVVRALFRSRQEYPEPGPRAETQITDTGYPVKMIRDHLSDIPQVGFPEGFKIRPMRLDEGGLWTDIWRDADSRADFSPQMFHNEFGHDLQATQWRSFIVTNPRGVAVATISAWYHRTFKGQDYGQIHWVAVRRDYWGRGLGKAMLTHALNQMAQWHDRAFLETQSKRIPAIKIYLDFGFIPDLDAPNAGDAWQNVKDNLDHPVLQAIDLKDSTDAET